MKVEKRAAWTLAIGWMATSACQSLIAVQDSTIVNECVNSDDCGPGKTCSADFTCVPIQCVEAGCGSSPAGPDAGGNDGPVGKADVVGDESSPDADASGALVISVGSLPSGLCTGGMYTFQFEAVGGPPPYTWSVESPTNAELSTIDATRAQFAFTPLAARPGSLVVALHDSSNQVARRPVGFAVNETPRIVTESLALELPVPSTPSRAPICIQGCSTHFAFQT
jgi:hypothetical protein